MLRPISLMAVVLGALLAVAHGNPAGRIVGGVDAYDAQFPHQISLRRSGSHICGGSIISKNYVLTAAHCVIYQDEEDNIHTFDAKLFSIRAGSNDRLSGGVVKNVEKILVHELYTAVVLNDVALMKLAEPLIFSQRIKAIPLASAEVPAGEEVIISGWGRLKTGGDIPQKLQYNYVEAISKTKCMTMIGMNYNELICLNHNRNNGACNGDSGGPAIYKNELVGVAGFVVLGCGTTRPDGYAKVFYHVDWIKQNSDL